MMQRGAFFLVLCWSVLATPAVGQGFPNSTVGDVKNSSANCALNSVTLD